MSEIKSNIAKWKIEEADKPWVLGVHTLVPYLMKSPEVYEKTVLKDSKGQLPPYCVAMGDSRRVRATACLFDKGTGVVINDLMIKNKKNPGRVAVAVGLYHGTPIVAFEHQMGSSGAEINVKEIIAKEQMTNTFKMGKVLFEADAKYVIRVGSAAGINASKEEKMTPPELKAYDVVVASHQVGISCADYSALSGSISSFDRSDAQKVKNRLIAMGYKMDSGRPVKNTDENLSKSLLAIVNEKLSFHNSSRENNSIKLGKAYSLGNVSKDSLYAETEEEAFLTLRKTLNVGSSEMEYATITRIAAHQTLLGDPVKTSMAACILGTLPGDSFAEIDKSVSSLVTMSALLGALETLHKVSKAHMTTQ
ncbi:hypothetical protein AAMO2058_000992400 [Amorphochlora amoebiformis]